MKSAARRVGVEVLGWALLVAGIAAIPLPGPGLLMLFGGLAVLSQQYEWAERRLAPVKYRAFKGAAESVQTWLRVVLSSSAAVLLICCGVLWISSPPMPGWWPLQQYEWSWLPGGLATGITQVVSGLIALALLAWSYRRYHGHPEAVAALEDEKEAADQHHAGASGPTSL